MERKFVKVEDLVSKGVKESQLLLKDTRHRITQLERDIIDLRKDAEEEKKKRVELLEANASAAKFVSERKELQSRINELEERIHELAEKIPKQGRAGGRRHQQQPHDDDEERVAAQIRREAYLAGQPRRRYKKQPAIPDNTTLLSKSAAMAARRTAIKKAFKDCWDAYKKHAWGHDELKPKSKGFHDWSPNRGLGLTLIDALSTLSLLNMTAEVDEALQWVKEKLDFSKSNRISAFESTIRIVGGLLSAYELQGERDRFLVEKAAELANKLLFAYNTTTGLPHQMVNLKTKQHWNAGWSRGSSVLSELGTIQLEFRTLSYHTKNPIYDQKATHVANILEAQCRTTSYLCPLQFSVEDMSPTSEDGRITLGSLADSYYEYLLKQWLLTGKTEDRYAQRALAALNATIATLIKHTQGKGRYMFLADIAYGSVERKMDELACFAGGMFALAGYELKQKGNDLTSFDRALLKQFTKVGEGLTRTCYQMFKMTSTGLGPESAEFDRDGEIQPGQNHYLQRPETSEAVFYMWRLTGEEQYRAMQWDMFLHFRHYCQTESGGFSGITDVFLIPPEQDDQQQSFLLAETFKYMYLTFADDVLPLNEWVLNTEAHPLRIRHRDPLDVWVEWEDSHTGQLPWYPPLLEGVNYTLTPRMKKRNRRLNNRKQQKDTLAISEPPEEPDQLVNMGGVFPGDDANKVEIPRVGHRRGDESEGMEMYG